MTEIKTFIFKAFDSLLDISSLDYKDMYSFKFNNKSNQFIDLNITLEIPQSLKHCYTQTVFLHFKCCVDHIQKLVNNN